jgi:hypothetical protein
MAATPEFVQEPSPAIAVKGKEALVEAVEDIVFGSVCALVDSFCITNISSDRWYSWQMY